MKRVRAASVPSAMLLLALAACGPVPSDVPLPGSALETLNTVPGERVEASQSRLFRAEPAVLETCLPGVVTIHWDLRAEMPDVAGVRIFAGPADSAVLFAEGVASGQAATGAWALPGTELSLHRSDDGRELERLVIGGPLCR